MEYGPQQPGPKISRIIAQALILFGAALIVYWPTFRAPFQFDDFGSIVNNKYIHLEDLRPSSLARAAIQDFHQNRPLSNLTFAINYYFSEDKTFSYHLVNFLVLVLTALGVWLFLKKLFSRLQFDPSRADLAAWLSALVWVVHPVNVQAVTYVVQRHTALAGAFSVWSLYFYHLARERKNPRPLFYILCALFCLMAMLCKENTAVMPAIIFIYGLYFFDGFSQGWLARSRKWILALMLFYILAAGLVLRPSMIGRGVFDFSKIWFSGWQKLLTGPRTMVWYFFLTLFPIPQHLSVVHDYPVSKSLFHPWTTAVCIMAVLTVAASALRLARRGRIFSFCVVWYFGNLLIESMPLPIDLVNEQRLYLASLAIIVPAVAWPVFKAGKAASAVALILLAAAFLGFFSHERNDVWRSWASLWRDAVKKSPDSGMTWKSYCAVFSEQNQCRTAMTACARAEQLGGRNFTTRYVLGRCHLSTARLELAEKELSDALKLAPPEKNFNYIAYNLAQAFNKNGDYENSERWCRKLISVEPGNVQARLLLAHNLLSSQKDEQYLEQMKSILGMVPKDVEVRKELALAFAERGRCQESLSLIENFKLGADDLEKIDSLCRKQE